ncbi:Hypothetical predicted protein [Paramuricea clavata]|uniref:Uncharacterized protein n=1 Tax=Paramuricea clavata TaxID=317549 RepID=A0A6S7KD32_PARCT|nr:Hypothetical predicted protein [Paramuricea clavata]
MNNCQSYTMAFLVSWQYGKPVSGKSTAVEAAMAVIGQEEKIGECMLAATKEILSRQSLPYWWDDVNNFDVLEKVALASFNKSSKKTRNIPEYGFQNSPSYDDESYSNAKCC